MAVIQLIEELMPFMPVAQKKQQFLNI